MTAAEHNPNRRFLATFRVTDEDMAHYWNRPELHDGDMFTEEIIGSDQLDALDSHGGFSWAE